jgi:hypothetical protein
MADAQRNTILQFDQMAGQEELTVTGMAFEPRRAWAATNRGLFAWDRDRQFWSLFAVGGIHLDSPVEDVSVTDDGTLVVTVRPEDAPPQRWTCDLERSEWRLP